MMLNSLPPSGPRGNMTMTSSSSGSTEAIVMSTRATPSPLLRIISARMGKYQTTEERLARYDALLGPKGDSLDPSVRSRLALDAALLLKETGDEKGFLDKLKLAARLDGTNKDAALLAFNFYRDRGGSAAGRLELLANILYADPVDPNISLMIAGELADRGAYVQARRFHRIGQNINKASSAPANFTVFSQALILDWLIDGANTPLNLLTRMLNEERNKAARTRREMLGDNPSAATTSTLSSIPKPEDVRLSSIEQEEIRIGAAWVVGDNGKLTESVGDLTASLNGENEIYATPNTRPRGMSEETALTTIRENLTRSILWRLATGKNNDKTVDDMAKVAQGQDPNTPAARAINAWKLIQDGAFSAALAACDPTDSDKWLMLAKATALEKLSKTSEAADAYAALAAQDTLSVFSTIALERWYQVRGQTRPLGDSPTPDARAASDYASKIPDWIDTIVDKPRMIQTLSADTGPDRLGALDRSTLKITLKNLSPIPLAVGSNKPINTRLLFTPKIELGAADRNAFGEPEVVDLARRLRLLPGEDFSASLSPDAGVLGWMAQNASGEPTRVRWRILQGFETHGGARDRGVGCLEILTPTQARDALIESRLPADSLVERINAASDATLPSVLTGARAFLSQPPAPGQLASPNLATVAQALADKYPTWSPTGRLLAAAAMPPSSQIADLKVLDDVIRADADPRVRLVAVITRAASADDRALRAAQESGDPRLARAAALQIQRAESDQPIVAKSGVARLMNKNPTATGITP